MFFFFELSVLCSNVFVLFCFVLMCIKNRRLLTLLFIELFKNSGIRGLVSVLFLMFLLSSGWCWVCGGLTVSTELCGSGTEGQSVVGGILWVAGRSWEWAGPLDLYGKEDAPALHESPSYGSNSWCQHGITGRVSSQYEDKGQMGGRVPRT